MPASGRSLCAPRRLSGTSRAQSPGRLLGSTFGLAVIKRIYNKLINKFYFKYHSRLIWVNMEFKKNCACGCCVSSGCPIAVFG